MHTLTKLTHDVVQLSENCDGTVCIESAVHEGSKNKASEEKQGNGGQ